MSIKDCTMNDTSTGELRRILEGFLDDIDIRVKEVWFEDMIVWFNFGDVSKVNFVIILNRRIFSDPIPFESVNGVSPKRSNGRKGIFVGSSG